MRKIFKIIFKFRNLRSIVYILALRYIGAFNKARFHEDMDAAMKEETK